MFSPKIWFVKTLTRIVKYKSRAVKSNLASLYSKTSTGTVDKDIKNVDIV